MKRSRFSAEQIAVALQQVGAGTPVSEICRSLQVTEQTFYRWKKKYGSLGTPETRQPRQVREKNKKLKQLVADLKLDSAILREAASGTPIRETIRKMGICEATLYP